MDARGTLNFTERSPGSRGSGVVTMTGGMPSIRVREAKIAWSFGERLTSARRGGMEWIESSMGVTVLFWGWMTRSFSGISWMSVKRKD